MFRLALRPRFLALLGAVVLAACACAWLSQWQWSRAQPQNTAPFATASPVALETVLQPNAPFTISVQGRPVLATGHFEPEQQVLVAGRSFDGRQGYIVLSPLVLDATGARLAVARGWVATADEAPAPPTGTVTVTGRLVVSETGSNEILPKGQVAAIATTQLLNLWGGEIYTGYLVAQPAEGSAASTATVASDPVYEGLNVLPAPSLQQETGLHLENVSYAVQWIVFGIFGFFVWFRQVRDAYLAEREEAEQRAEAELAAARGEASTGDAAHTPVTRGSATKDVAAPTSSSKGQ
ncbi:SURF1 family protein [Micrococcales bacterium 31B]|nr:SURF1 family protein [Micrococcales bacterium 31B]